MTKIYNINVLHREIKEWAINRNIHTTDCIPMQELKLIEECGELSRAIINKNDAEIKDAIGDIYIVLVILALQNDESELRTTHDLELVSWDPYSYFITRIIEYTIEFDFLGASSNLCELATRLGTNLWYCANLAWNQIKNRKGTTVNGAFIKESDINDIEVNNPTVVENKKNGEFL